MSKKDTKVIKELERRLGTVAASMAPYQDHLDFRLFDNLSDDAFAYLMHNVKGVNMLDLNETDITNESIVLLTGLEYVNELRAKQCRNLNNGCIKDLNKLTSLVFLHVTYTDINIDGLLKLHDLLNLKTLMFSADDIEVIKEKLLQLKTMLPLCDLVINSKPYYFNTIHLFNYALIRKPFTYRLKIKNEPLVDDWSSWLCLPSGSYIEAEAQGPYSIKAIEWIDINSVENRREGKLVEEIKLDPTEEIIKLLNYLSFPFITTDGIISVYILEGEI